jgi:hypothetical protein
MYDWGGFTLISAKDAVWLRADIKINPLSHTVTLADIKVTPLSHTATLADIKVNPPQSYSNLSWY